MTSRSRLPALLLALALAGIAGCAGERDRVEVIASPDTFDPVLRQALVESRVTALERPSPESAALVELGRTLFFDKLLSGAKDISCAGCHRPEAFTGDGLPVAEGAGATGTAPNRTLGTGRLIARNAMPLFNLGTMLQPVAFHDGRVERDPSTGRLKTGIAALDIAVPFPPTNGAQRLVAQLTSALAAQAMFPVLDRREMRGEADGGVDANELADATDPFVVWDLIMKRLVGTDLGGGGFQGGIEEYRTLFGAAFPGTPVAELTFGHAARAIAAFEKELLTNFSSPFDRYVRGDLGALTDAQKRGALIFFGKTRKGKCANCHLGPLLTDFSFHAIGVPQLGPGRQSFAGTEPAGEDRGRALVTGRDADSYKFRTPALRNIARTAPYFHDGAYATLREVIVHYNDIEASLTGYATAFAGKLPPDVAGTYDGDPARVQARLAASKAATLLPQKLGLTEREIDDLVAFLESLTDADPVTLGKVQPATVPSALPVLD